LRNGKTCHRIRHQHPSNSSRFKHHLDYEPLGKNEIRILERIGDSKDLIFRLRRVTFGAELEYSALSYVWGTEKSRKPITVNDKKFWPTKNLYDALERLRHHEKAYCLWVDAICINQRDEIERAKQIQIMGDIFANALAVLVWLGYPSNETNANYAIEMIDDLHHHFGTFLLRYGQANPNLKPKGGPVRQFRAYMSQQVSVSKKLWDQPGTRTHRAWKGIAAFLQSSWWSRTWVFQEGTIPESESHIKVEMMYGPHKTTWFKLRIVINVIGAFYVALGHSAINFLAQACWNAENMERIRIARFYRGDRLDLLDVLDDFRRSSCMEPKDKLYAPLCIVPSSSEYHILPDYRKSILEAYLDVAKLYLARGRLDFLGFLGVKKSRVNHDWPFWLPDWRKNSDALPLPRRLKSPVDPVALNHIGDSNSYDSLLKPVYKATGTSQMTAYLDGRNLIVEGLFCDQISDLIPIPHGYRFKEARTALRLALQRWKLEDTDVYFTGEDFLDVLMKTLAVDVAYTESMDYPVTRMKKAKHGYWPNQHDLDYAEREKYEYHWNHCLRHRALCRTKQGYIGLVHKRSKPGDNIYGFLGGNVLYSIRKVKGFRSTHDTTFEFIGECYMHGFMDGKLMELVRAGAVKAKQLILV
jgi:hypothetical protein